jgi:type II secretory pathway pseudopilin PulG
MNTASALQDNRGMATSLLEAVMVIAIVAVIAGIALVSAMEQIENAKLSRAMADAEMIGISIHSFMHDTGFAPAFKAGDARGPEDEIFSVLETLGSDPGVEDSLNWPGDAATRDRLENQLVKNRPSDSGNPYPRMGQISFARLKGWNGPYVSRMPSSDPWDNKYLVNVQLLTAKGVKMVEDTLPLTTGQRPAVFVVSAGPNRQLETRFDQSTDSFIAGGDDIVFRIQ